MAAHMAKEA